MQPVLLDRFRDVIKMRGSAAAQTKDTLIDSDQRDALFYVPFEHVNAEASLVIVGITPGPNQMREAYVVLQSRIRGGLPDDTALRKAKEIGAFSSPTMRPNLIRMLDAMGFSSLLGIPSCASLWSEAAKKLHATSVVPHAAFRRGKPFAGSFSDLMASPVFRRSFENDFLPSLAAIQSTAVYVALGPTPLEALDWCAARGFLRSGQIMGALAHPSTNGGSQVKVFLGEATYEDLNSRDPVRGRCAWLNEASARMRNAIALRSGIGL